MVVSFHPLYVADKNLLCAGREPDEKDVAAVQSARAVVLPQGCRQSLYQIARNHCAHVFPNYDARFNFSGKIGQIRLFRAMDTIHPRTLVFDNLKAYHRYQDKNQRLLPLPFVFKFNWGGEGHTVFPVRNEPELDKLIAKATEAEASGDCGFLIQELVPHSRRSLRVAVIGQRFFSYWRLQKNKAVFGSGIRQGAVIDRDSDPDLQHIGIEAVRNFCRQSGVNLAGFDLLFAPEDPQPTLLEFNTFFGRRGLGGSERYYEILISEIDRWLTSIEESRREPNPIREV